jgi:hypothetical protein
LRRSWGVGWRTLTDDLTLAFFRQVRYIDYPVGDGSWMLSHESGDNLTSEQVASIEAKGGRVLTQGEIFELMPGVKARHDELLGELGETGSA